MHWFMLSYVLCFPVACLKNKINLFSRQSSSEFKSWVCKASVNTDTRCKLCKVNTSLTSMTVMALKSHVKHKAHKKLAEEQNAVKNFFVKD